MFASRNLAPAQMETNLGFDRNFRGLGVSLIGNKPTIFFYSSANKLISTAVSDDGLEFANSQNPIEIKSSDGSILDGSRIRDTRVSPIFKNYIIFYKNFDNPRVYLAKSENQISWQTLGQLPAGIGTGLNVENFVYRNQHVFYFGGDNINIGYTQDGTNWEFVPANLEGQNSLEVDYVLKTTQGIFLLYHYYSISNSKKFLEVKTVCFDKDNPSKVLWHTKNSLWPEPELWTQKEAYCIGSINFQGRLLSYWNVPNTGIFTVTYPFIEDTPVHEHKHFKLEKHPANPILTPKPENEWENEAVFNPAAFSDNGKVYLIYRAVGKEYISVLGYAESRDGIHFHKRLDSPIFTGSAHFDTKSPRANVHTARRFISGGGYGGCEDPRITKIDNKLYMVYVAFNGYSEPRLALTSIYYDDFIKHRFLWEKPVLISPPGVIDKSGCILPEKINGKYVIFHRIYPDILIDYVDNLNFDGKTWLKGQYKISPRPTMWDSRKVGTGAPPIKTKDGWLLIYQAVNDRDDSKYRIGAMLLDLNDPTKVLYRTNHPIIEPTEHYENNLSKFGVVYPCGAVIVKDRLMVYYGGSDSVTCVATANLEEFLNELKSGNGARLAPLNIND